VPGRGFGPAAVLDQGADGNQQQGLIGALLAVGGSKSQRGMPPPVTRVWDLNGQAELEQTAA
jgi:hypothetical protein